MAEESAKPRATAAAVALGAATAFADVVHRDDVDGGGVGGKDADADTVIIHALASTGAGKVRLPTPTGQTPAGTTSAE